MSFMDEFSRLIRRDCIDCSGDLPTCSPGCKANQRCTVTVRACYKCPIAYCDPPESKGGINPGVIAGPIIAAVVLIASLALFWWLKRKKKRDLARLEELADRARKGESSAFHLSSPGSPRSSSRHRSQTSAQMMANAPQNGTASSGLPAVPAEAEYVDEHGATIRVYNGKRGVINADPNHPDNGGSVDPFADAGSLSTGGASSGHSTNVIPIRFVPAGQSDDTLAQVLAQHRAAGPASAAAQQAAAARTLDQARQNLLRPAGRPYVAPPPRPARAPDLDLRLRPQPEEGPSSSRDSIKSAVSLAPSYMSGATADMHLDVPKIMTRTQVHVGRLQAAEVVHIGGVRAIAESPESDVNPFSSGSSAEMLDASSNEAHAGVSPGAVSSAATYGSPRTPNPPHSGGAAAASNTSLGSRRFDDGGNAAAQPSPTDLRFSMGSLAYDRASISTVGTGNRGHPMGDMPPVPSVPPEYVGRPRFESVASYQSTGGDSLLGSFPMMVAGQQAGASPTDMQVANAPPGAFKGSNLGGRPLTATSVHSGHSAADSFLGNFPFLPPNVSADGSARGPVTQGGPAGVSTTSLPRVSGVSEGLGEFDFSFDNSDPNAGHRR